MSLTGKKPGESYKDLLQLDNSNSGVDGTLRNVKDGDGASTPLQLSTAAVAVTSTPLNTTDVATKGYVDGKQVSATIVNATGSRSANTDYTNTTGYPIFLSILLSAAVSSNIEVRINGTSVYGLDITSTGTNDVLSYVAVVPNGAVYRLAVVAGSISSITRWTETEIKI